MVSIFNTPADVSRAISIIEWSKQYMKMNEAHTSKLDYVEASLILLRRSAATGGEMPDDHAALVASTLKNCIHFHDLNSAEAVDPAWVASLERLKSVKADWF